MSEEKDIVITVEERKGKGKEKARQLRQQGLIPATLYGGEMDPMPITVNRHAVQQLLRREGGENSIFLLQLKGTDLERRAMIKEIQTDPLTRDISHIDFIRVITGHKLHVMVPIELVGDSIGVRHGGLVDFVSRSLRLEILPREMVDKVQVDISTLDVDQHLSVADIAGLLPESGRFLEDPKRVVVTIEAPRGGVHGLEEETELGAAPAPVIAETVEPVVIRKRKATEGKE